MRLFKLPLAALLLAGTFAPGSGAPASAQVPAPAAETFSPVDVERLLTDRDYAERYLSADLPEPAAADARRVLIATRAVAFAAAERRAEAAAVIDALTQEGGSKAAPYGLAWRAAMRMRDGMRGLAVLDAAARNVAPGDRGAIHGSILPDDAFALARVLRSNRLDAERERLYAALDTLGWPGELKPGTRDGVRLTLAGLRLDRGDRAGAARTARAIQSPDPLVTLLTTRKYDGLRPAGDAAAILRRANAFYDRATAAAVARAPRDFRIVLERAQFLRGVGRYGEALALLSPHVADVPAAFAADELGMWLVNEAAYALLDLGRNAEGVALMERLVAQDMERRAGLIGPSINYIEILRSAGRHEESLAHAERLRSGPGSRSASAYGKAWMDAGSACALAGLGRAAEAAPYLERLRADEEVNPAALSRALLCHDLVDEAAALMVRRLAGEDPEEAIRALQIYELKSAADRADPLTARLERLAARPDVAAALARVGRSLRLPLASTYWGSF